MTIMSAAPVGPAPASRFSSLCVCAVLVCFPLAFGHANLVHQYELNGTYADELGGPALSPGGSAGSGVLGPTDTEYVFGPNQGLSLSGALFDPATYSILVDFEFNALSGYAKIVDFANLTSDSGLYAFGDALQIVGAATGDGPAGALSEGVYIRMVITRDDTTDVFVGYVNGVQQFSVSDTAGDYIFSGTNGIIQFFNDDTTTQEEAAGGAVNRVEIYDTALTSGEVATLGGPAVPEPTTLCLLGLVAVSVAFRRVRSRE